MEPIGNPSHSVFEILLVLFLFGSRSLAIAFVGCPVMLLARPRV